MAITPDTNKPVDLGGNVVKQPEDKTYSGENLHVKNPAERKEREEQPVEPVKEAPTQQ